MIDKIRAEIDRCKTITPASMSADTLSYDVTEEDVIDITAAVQSGRIEFEQVHPLVDAIRYGPYDDVEDALRAAGL